MKKITQTSNYKLPTSSGFTLIEILVVFTIAAILSGVGFAAFASYSRAQQLEQVASQIKLMIGEAKFNALSTVKRVTNDSGLKSDCGSDQLLGYSIYVPPTPATTLQLNQVCSVGAPKIIKTLTLPSGLSFVSAAPASTCANIQFDMLSAMESGGGCSLKISGLGKNKTITIDTVGNVLIE